MPFLRIPDSYDAKIAKIWTLWPVIQLIYGAFCKKAFCKILKRWFINPAGIFDSGLVLLNQNVNGCVCTYVNHSRTVAEKIKQ